VDGRTKRRRYAQAGRATVIAESGKIEKRLKHGITAARMPMGPGTRRHRQGKIAYALQ